MLLPIKRFIGIPIMSLQTGAQLAKTAQPIVDPRQLKIVAFYVDGPRLTEKNAVLHPEDIREFSDIGMIVDSEEQLMSTEGLVRLQEIINYGFELIGTRVEDEQGRKLGKVASYALDPESYYVQQLYTQPSLLKRVVSTALTIHRSQIVSITNERITVRSNTVEQSSPVENVVKEFVNPFRSSALEQPETASLSLDSGRHEQHHS